MFVQRKTLEGCGVLIYNQIHNLYRPHQVHIYVGLKHGLMSRKKFYVYLYLILIKTTIYVFASKVIYDTYLIFNLQ